MCLATVDCWSIKSTSGGNGTSPCLSACRHVVLPIDNGGSIPSVAVTPKVAAELPSISREAALDVAMAASNLKSRLCDDLCMHLESLHRQLVRDSSSTADVVQELQSDTQVGPCSERQLAVSFAIGCMVAGCT